MAINYRQKMNIIKKDIQALWLSIKAFLKRLPRRMTLYAGAGLMLLFFLTMFLTNKIDTSPTFADKPQYVQHPQSLQTWQSLIEREVSMHTFVPNKPFFFPSAYLGNMRAFQTGIIEGLALLTTHAALHTNDSELLNAAELLRYPPDIWLFGHSKDGKISKSSTQQYKRARHALDTYTGRTKTNDYFLSTRDGVLKTILFLRSDLRTISDRLHTKITKSGSDNKDSTSSLFFWTKGRLYVIALFIRDMIAHDTQLSDTEQQYLRSALLTLLQAIDIDPMIVLNSSMNRTFLANHLTYQAFGVQTTIRILSDLERILR